MPYTTVALAVHKYPLPMGDEVEVEMPRAARILTVQVQNGAPCIWAVVDPRDSKVARRFRVAGTGHPILVSGDPLYAHAALAGAHIGSFQLSDGALVFHVFELPSAESR